MKNSDILFEDNHIIVVIKPHNLLSQGDITGDKDLYSMVKNYIKVKYNKPGNVYLGLIHRLDRPTRGIMVFAKTSKAARRLSDDIKKHKNFNKEYILVCHGKLEGSGEFEDYLTKDDNMVKVTDNTSGKYSSLNYEAIEYNKEHNVTLVKVKLNTGRQHQIRVQFMSRNHPLYGDNRYGKCDNEQLCLTATKLEFMHPVKHELMTFKCNIDYNLKGYSYFNK